MKTRSIEPENRSPFSYNLKKCEISGERMSGSIELSAVSIEIKLFENINNPFISGEIAILDNDDLMNRIGFSGTEKLLVEIETEFANIRKNFIVTEVINTLSTNGKDKVILLQVLEDISFLSKLIRVSKSYSGSPDIIIKNILKEHLNRDMFNISSQNHNDGPMKIIVPNLTPLGACEWIQRRAVTKSGMPFYLFSTLADDKIRYVDLETILTSKPLNALDSPYFYNQGIANNNLDENGQSFIINDTAQSNAENTIMLCQLGFMSSTYTHTRRHWLPTRFRLLLQRLLPLGACRLVQRGEAQEHGRAPDLVLAVDVQVALLQIRMVVWVEQEAHAVHVASRAGCKARGQRAVVW